MKKSFCELAQFFNNVLLPFKMKKTLIILLIFYFGVLRIYIYKCGIFLTHVIFLCFGENTAFNFKNENEYNKTS